MARGVLPITEITRAGVAPAAETVGDPVNNHTLPNDGCTVLLVRNANGTTAETLTVHFSTVVDGQAVTNRTLSVPANASRYIGPFPTSAYGASVLLDVATADLMLSAYHIPRS